MCESAFKLKVLIFLGYHAYDAAYSVTSKPEFTRLQGCRDYENAWFASETATMVSIKTALSWLGHYCILRGYTGDQKVSVHLMIKIEKVTSNVQSIPRQPPEIY
jgi:hypothetical protein